MFVDSYISLSNASNEALWCIGGLNIRVELHCLKNHHSQRSLFGSVIVLVPKNTAHFKHFNIDEVLLKWGRYSIWRIKKRIHRWIRSVKSIG